MLFTCLLMPLFCWITSSPSLHIHGFFSKDAPNSKWDHSWVLWSHLEKVVSKHLLSLHSSPPLRLGILSPSQSWEPQQLPLPRGCLSMLFYPEWQGYSFLSNDAELRDCSFICEMLCQVKKTMRPKWKNDDHIAFAITKHWSRWGSIWKKLSMWHKGDMCIQLVLWGENCD